jgi:hypothetical protein
MSADCHECDRLQKTFREIVRQNIAILEQFTPTLFFRQEEEIEAIRRALVDVEAQRREAQLKWMAHRATHEDEKKAATHN